MTLVNADVTVAGNGLLGLSAAFELLRRDLTVTVIGPRAGDHQGQASRAAGAMLTVFSEVEASHPLHRAELEVGQRIAARQLYGTWLSDVNAAAGTSVTLNPGVWVIGNGFGRDDDAELKAIHAAAQRNGWAAEFGDVRDVEGLAPQHRAFAALLLAGEASVDPAAILSALETAVAGHPRCQWIDAHAATVSAGGDHLMVTADDGQAAISAHLVLAAGAASGLLLDGELAKRAAIPPVFSGRGVSMTVTAPFRLPVAVRTPNRGFACGSHIVPRPDGTVYLGATNRLSTEPDADRRPGLDEIATLIHDGAAELNTGLRQAALVQARVGHRPVTVDHLPLIGTTGHPMIHVATATYRCGVLLAPLAANLIADGITVPGCHGDHPYRPTRPMPAPDLAELIGMSASGLVDMLCQPGGILPAGTADTLARVLAAGLREMSAGTSTQSKMMRRIWDRAPMQEAVPLLLDAAGRMR